MKKMLLLLCLILISSCAAMCIKKPNFKNTRWVAVYQIFVADAGNETHTETLEFTSSKTYRKMSEWNLPPYPAMYRNADGTIDTMPGHSSSFEEEGTWSYHNGKVTLKSKDGGEMVLEYKDGKLEGEAFPGLPIVFERQSE